MQSAKFIDVTRSYVPVDPNTYPENLHSTTKEDHPEQRFPVVPYMGWNFLPTSYGYKSYFGTNSALGIDTLSPNKPDKVFLFQTLTFKNILIALCDTGIWTKDSTVTGTWTQEVEIAVPGELTFYEWYATTIKNKLYVFRNNAAVYHVIETEDSVAGFSVTEVTPTFIDLTTQLGMSRVGSRLCFWDANNALSYGSPDDLSDFTPAILTGANVTTFNSILGRIVAVVPHGKHVIAYATKSWVLLQVEANETFLLKALPILTGCGIAYQRQVVAGAPDTTHYAWGDTGIYKIESGKPEQIVPEFFDYMKPYNSQPVYMNMLQNRYLCFEPLDPNAIVGNGQFSKTVVPPSNLLFSAMPLTLEEVNEAEEDEISMCDVMAGLTQDAFVEQQAAASAGVPDALRKPGTSVQPVYTCYLSLNNGPQAPIVWGTNPCGGTAKVDGSGVFTPSPTGDAGKVSQLTSDSTNKTAKTGAESWTDGKWTMERFVQYQTAAWNAQEKAILAYLEEIAGRVETATKTEEGLLSCAASNTSVDCYLGRYAKEFSDPEFGFNKCSFWLTRYVTDVVDLNNTLNVTANCAPVETFSLWKMSGHDWNVQQTDYSYGSAAAAAAVAQAAYEAWFGSEGRGPYLVSEVIASSANGAPIGYAVRATIGGGVVCQVSRTYTVTYTKTTNQGSQNSMVEVEPQAPVPETAYCELTGWSYTDVNGNPAVMAATTCDAPGDKYPQATNPSLTVPQGAGRPTQLTDEGSICGIPFDLMLEDSLLPPVTWEDVNITYPPVEFFVQQGSIAPKYPTLAGAFVYDLALKKWGKLRTDYKQLLDYSPINSGSSATVGFATFGIVAGLIKEDGLIYLFDNQPASSQITWGKFGFYRLGMTDLEEVRIDFASSSSGSVIVETSLEGDALTTDLVTTKNFSGRSVIVYPEYSGKWHNITVTGIYDVTYMQINGLHKGRR